MFKKVIMCKWGIRWNEIMFHLIFFFLNHMRDIIKHEEEFVLFN